VKIPKKDSERLDFYREVNRVCLASRQGRVEQYSQWRNYFLFGTASDDAPAPWNLMYAHLDTVTAFLYASDTTRFAVRMGSKAPKIDHKRTGPFGKRIMEEWSSSNADTIYELAILWALVYSTTIVKHIRRGNSVHPFMVDPACFGVYREDETMLDRQEAFVHVYYTTKTDLAKRIALHPHRESILKTAEDVQARNDTGSATPAILDRIVLTSGQPGIGSTPNITGETNILLTSIADYTAKMEVPVIEMQELYVWNDDIDDYQTVTMASEKTVIYDRQNIFLPRRREMEGEHGFVKICPNPMADYFWGQSEAAKLSVIQDNLNSRLDEISKLEKKEVDPPNAFGGMGITEEKINAFNSPGASVALDDPAFKRETYAPQISAQLYASIDRFQTQMDVTSGLPNVVQGKGESGVRSAGHAGKLLTVGSARIKKRALTIEKSLECGATLYGKCLFMDEPDELFDDESRPFVISQMDPHFFVDVDAHSNSPVFMENNQDLADRLLGRQAITRKRYIQMTHPPMEEELLRDLDEVIIPNEQRAAAAEAEAEAAKQAGAGKPKLKAVS
jgi:hypothetical protein